jgi:replicative DNA helicase
MEIRTKARRLLMENDLGLIVIDYLQLMSGTERRNSDNRVQEVSEISRALKALARELNVPILALSQLSRAVEHRPDKRPMLADLRESGSIEQDADVVMFIYRDEVYEEDTEKKNIAEILIRKHRHGPTGDVQLFWKPEYMKFATVEKKLEES